MTVRPGKGSLHRQVVNRPRPLGPDLTGWKLPAGLVAPTQSPVEDTRLLMVGGNGYCQRAIGLDPLFNDECKAAPGSDLFNGGGHWSHLSRGCRFIPMDGRSARVREEVHEATRMTMERGCIR